MYFSVVWRKKNKKKNILLKSKLAAKHKKPFHINQLYHGFSHLFFILLESLLQSRSKVYFIQTIFFDIANSTNFAKYLGKLS